MAGFTLRGTAIHVPAEQKRPPEIRPALVESTVSIMGRAYRTTIHEGASAEQLIEKVANENGGYVTKKFYPEFNTSEIISVRIGNELLVKSTESGIHFSLGESGIPMAVVNGQAGKGTTDIVFPNAEELRVGRATCNIALWMTSANFDPGNISDLDSMYSRKGGARLSRDALDEVSKAHGGVRSEKLMLVDNILVLNKDTGEVLTAKEHLSRPQDIPAPVQGERIALGMPTYSIAPPVSAEPIRTEAPRPLQFDAFPGGLDRTIIRTFDGMLTDFVRIRFNPIPAPAAQEERPAGILERPLSAMRSIHPPRIVFTLLSFPPASTKSDDSRKPAAQPEGASCSPRPVGALLKPPADDRLGAGEQKPGTRHKGPEPSLRPAPAFIDAPQLCREPELRDALHAWRAPRKAPLEIPIPSGAIPLSGADRRPNPAGRFRKAAGAPSKNPHQKAPPRDRKRERKKRRRRTLGEDRRPQTAAKRRNRAECPAPMQGADSGRRRNGGAGARKAMPSRGIPSQSSFAGRKQPRNPCSPKSAHRNAPAHKPVAKARARKRPAHAPGMPEAAARKGTRRRRAQARITQSAKTAGKPALRRPSLLHLIGLFRRRRKKVTGRSGAGNSG